MLASTLESHGAELMAFGPEDVGVRIAASFGEYEAEYAAIRRSAGVLHLPQRAILRLTGADVKDFLHRLLTQDINTMNGGDSRRSFLLNEKGRIVADMYVHHGDLDTWIETDVFDLPDVMQSLDHRLFAEDVAMADWTDQRTALAIHGPAAAALLEQVLDEPVDTQLLTREGIHYVLRIAGAAVSATRRDEAGALGIVLFVEPDKAEAVYEKLLQAAGYEADEAVDDQFAQRRRQTLRGRPIGWLAYNTARIEAGCPLMHIDFGRDSLPGETALLDQTVHFQKGCYLGQEIVARMQNLGHPKRICVALKFETERLPIAGSQVFEPDAEGHSTGTVVGGVTSSTLSPLLSNAAIALAVVKWGKHKAGKTLLAPAEGNLEPGIIQPQLRFLP